MEFNNLSVPKYPRIQSNRFFKLKKYNFLYKEIICYCEVKTHHYVEIFDLLIRSVENVLEIP